MRNFPALIAATIILLFTMACASMRSIGVDFDLVGTARMVDEQGGDVAGASRPLAQTPRPAGSLNPFNKLHYESTLFSAEINLNSFFMTVAVENKSGLALQVRFDQATVTSNYQQKPLPLRVFVARANDQFVHAGKGREPIAALPLSLDAGTKGASSFSASYAQLYESGRLFGVDFPPKQPVLLTTGVGNIITYRIPVQHGAERSYWIIELTAKQARARASYH